ncbi:unnamed protein product, partial [Rangifer tarandus platyrhynchus]
MNGVWKNLCLKIIHDFGGLEKVDEESKKIFSDSITLSDKLELDLQKDHFIELLEVQHKKLANEDLMELEAESKDEERPKEEIKFLSPGKWNLTENLSMFGQAAMANA